jgi:hypothetical protein
MPDTVLVAGNLSTIVTNKNHRLCYIWSDPLGYRQWRLSVMGGHPGRESQTGCFLPSSSCLAGDPGSSPNPSSCPLIWPCVPRSSRTRTVTPRCLCTFQNSNYCSPWFLTLLTIWPKEIIPKGMDKNKKAGWLITNPIHGY